MSASPAATVAAESSGQVVSSLHAIEPDPSPATDYFKTEPQHDTPETSQNPPDDPIKVPDQAIDITPTTLRPSPRPSTKRRESEVNGALPLDLQRPADKKRKRAPSPPWQFPSAETTTLKTADGRRASARVNTAASATGSDADTRARSSSVSVLSQQKESPPWKKFAAEGPSSMVVDGKRKSGRVNRELPVPPKRVSPRSKKQAPEAKYASTARTAQSSKALHAVVNGASSSRSSRPSNSSRSHQTQPEGAAKIAELRAKIEALQPSGPFLSPERHTQSGHKRKHSDESTPPPQLDGPSSPSARRIPPPHQASPMSPETTRPSPRLKLRFNPARHLVPPPHPHAIFPEPAHPPHPSIYQILEGQELKELQQPYMENERGPPDMAWFHQRAERQALEEGMMRRKLLREAESGGVLSKERLSLYQEAEAQAEPAKQYGHHDHLVAHALHLRRLQVNENTLHRALAKKTALSALEFWKAKRGPSEEDLQEEQDKIFRLIYKQIVVDMKAKWDLVSMHVQQRRVKVWEAEQEVRRQARLQEKLEWSENMVARQRGEADGESDQEMDEGSDVEGSGEDSDDDESSEEENMSESSSEAEEEQGENVDDGGGEMGDDELAAYLAQRAADEQEKSQYDSDPDDETSTGIAARQKDDEPDDEFEPQDDSGTAAAEDKLAIGSQPANRRSRRSSTTPVADDEQEFSSDESTDMDSTDYDSDEDMSSTGEEDNAGDDGEEDDEEDDVPRNSLLSLFKDEVRAIGLPTPTTSAEGDGERHTEPEAIGLEQQAEPEIENVDAHVLPEALAQNEEDNEAEAQLATGAETAHHPDAAGSNAMSPEAEMQLDADSLTRQHLVPSPALLRGKLRSYQHAGLDWLASLYRNGTNGILADEMGLGKTIQTIALLAHLAEEHECWETHLVIVPTSVVVNWVREFQRFLPGFRVLGYYGSSEERQLKRKGWVNDPHHENKEKRGYNVVITSYNVAMQDINAIRNVKWHYLVLDEAHNIRNFNSQRWQVLIRLRTSARLLLTGTPLQNSLTELWSLLTFLTAGDDDPQHGDLEEFLSHWKEPVKEIFDRGVQTLSHEAQRVVDQLHVSLRPFLLRRLKSEVEKDLPKKTEHVVVCKLSKRQRQLYQEYMGLAETKRQLTQSNVGNAGKVLLSLRRVCNHPDLFDPRPIQTSLGMATSAASDFAPTERIIRALLGVREDAPISMTAHEARRKYIVKRARQLNGTVQLRNDVRQLELEVERESPPDPSTFGGCQALQRLKLRQQRLEKLRSCIRTSERDSAATPIYGSDLRELVTVHQDRVYRFTAKDIRGRVISRHLRGWPALGRYPLKFELDHASDWKISQTSMLQRSTQTVESYAEAMQETIVKFAFCTPVVTAPVLDYLVPPRTQDKLRSSEAYPEAIDWAHEARIRTSIVFPDARLLVYDAGKLQRLSRLLRELQSRGSRSLIFTQMTGTLNILEQFLSLMNLPYLRLDGNTPVERRALHAAEFNRPDSKYQCMILSSRAGGVGLNLTGASSVIFYDLDWNPQMDRQCMDRAHRIGQVRDVEVYKMVSEKTVEENILRRANQKSLLDQTVIQEGHFTTEYQRARDGDDGEHEDDSVVAAAIERVFGGKDEQATARALESVEDIEDVQAAVQARKEERQDDVDFADRSSKDPSRAPTPGHQYPDADGLEDEESRAHHIDDYMIRLMDEVLLKGIIFVPPQARKLDRHGRDPSHRKRKR
ncbi:SNF2 family N-terminal domain-containing protein [Neohortaea acidophila]|uniref:DNA helicase n=1 Tax=Neohortaea acidophila TaxID=245834 RepID=A0A6A6PUX1_9PEZI|nr:SNF2 family N-terminal domain-containing protein [Neohortaea acidophila]KAF2483782.1 SNF2 family N-terminal domain-containing protein [Neohortaea acidophila]